MLYHERILGISSLLFKFVTETVRAKAVGEKSTSLTESFILRDYSRLLGLEPRESESLGVNKIILEVLDYWCWVDSYLDLQPLSVNTELGEIHHKGTSDKQRFQQVEYSINDNRLSQQTRDGLNNLIRDYKEKSFHFHKVFVSDFNPFLTPYESVLNYRQKTSGDMAEMIIRIVGLSVGANQEETERIISMARAEMLGVQMIDDLVDSISDFRRLPNLFNALLIEKPDEMRSFSEAISSQTIILTNRPYQIAESFAPETLAEYFDRYREVIEELPNERRDCSLQFMAAATYSSYTPKKGESINLFSILSKRTKT